MDYSRLCMGCMRTLEHNDSAFCPFCGYRIGTVNSSRGLQPKTVLNGKYLVGKIIGEGGFGITYLAYDVVLNYRVAIKEYFPSELVTRDTSTGIQTALTVLTGSREEQYKAGIERFINEARNLAAFNNLDGIVSVKEFFYENNTAYMVMEYIDGVSLSQYLNNYGNRLPYQQVISMLTPIMNSLEKVHESNIIHRDISPDNIMVSNDGRVKLIDFGAARMVDPDNKSLTVILKHGYAPEEQYQSRGNQGPWTDVYALAATMYRMITGAVPQEATDRIISGDKVIPVNKLVPEVPKHISDAITHGLAIKASDRPQSISVFRNELEKGPKKKFPFFIIGIVAVVSVLCAVGVLILTRLEGNKQMRTEENHFIDTVKWEESNTVSEKEDVFVEESYTEEYLIGLIEKESGYSVIRGKIEDDLLETVLMSYGQIDVCFSYCLYDDYNGDEKKELFAYVCTGEALKILSINNQLYSAGNTELWYSDGTHTFEVNRFYNDWLNEPDDYMPCGLSTIQFGRTRDVCEVYALAGMDTVSLYSQTYQINLNKVEPVIDFHKLLIDSDKEQNPIVYILSGGIMAWDHSLDSEIMNQYRYFGENWDGWDNTLYPYFYIYKSDNNYYIYDLVSVSEDELEGFANYSEIMNDVENALYCTEYASVGYALWWNKPYSIEKGQCYLSDNDKLYVNYALQTKPNVTKEEDELWNYPSKDRQYDLEYRITGVFTIKDNVLYLDGFMWGFMTDTPNIDDIIKVKSSKETDML